MKMLGNTEKALIQSSRDSNYHELLENEWYHVRHSGEIPEVALYSSIHYLTKDVEGPNLKLEEKEHLLLGDAAFKRYREIIMRDILPENRDTSIYRGILRSICNWRRFKRFCERHDLSTAPVREEVREQLILFLADEVEQALQGNRSSSINCTFEELYSFTIEMDVSLSEWLEDLEKLCLLV